MLFCLKCTCCNIMLHETSIEGVGVLALPYRNVDVRQEAEIWLSSLDTLNPPTPSSFTSEVGLCVMEDKERRRELSLTSCFAPGRVVSGHAGWMEEDKAL